MSISLLILSNLRSIFYHTHTNSPPEEFIAVPILKILETLDFHNFEPAIACLFVLVCSCAFLELFSEMFNLIVTLTTSDWKILSRQIGYEHGDSGSPVLAVFCGGSICAMISFACPLEIIVYFIAGSQLSAALIRAFYLFYSPFRPKYMVNTKSKQNAMSSSVFVFIFFINRCSFQCRYCWIFLTKHHELSNKKHFSFQTTHHLATVN